MGKNPEERYDSCMQRRLIAGDIHGRYGALCRVLEKAGYCDGSDTLYCVGDLADRGEDPVATLELLMSLSDFRPVLGNHDLWLESWLWSGDPDPVWVGWNGGDLTVRSIRKKDQGFRERLRGWLAAIPLLRIEHDAIIVHAGVPCGGCEADLLPLLNQPRKVPLLESIGRLESLLVWDRTYLKAAEDSSPSALPFNTEKTIFIGHTQQWRTGLPFICRDYHLVALDTGAGSGRGPLTVYDMDSGEFWSSPV